MSSGRELRYLLEKAKADGRNAGVIDGRIKERAAFLAYVTRMAPKSAAEVTAVLVDIRKGEHEKAPPGETPAPGPR